MSPDHRITKTAIGYAQARSDGKISGGLPMAAFLYPDPSQL